jgi:flagellar basal-body rod modification protein FlgD
MQKMPTTAVSGAQSATAAYGLDFQSLLQIILTQLTYQDPLKPLDNFQFVSQLAQFAQLQQTQSTNDSLTNLLNAQSAAQATGFLGKTVDFTSNAATQTGTVQSITFSSGVPNLTIKQSTGQIVSGVSLSTVTQVR